MVQWLRVWASNTGSVDLILVQGTKMPRGARKKNGAPLLAVAIPENNPFAPFSITWFMDVGQSL